MSTIQRVGLAYLVAIVAAFIFAFVVPALAHSWYDIGCCSEGDCEPLPTEALTDVGNGWMIRYESPRWGYIEEFFPDAEVRLSKDGRAHGCFKTPTAYSPRHMRCLYIPVSG